MGKEISLTKYEVVDEQEKGDRGPEEETFGMCPNCDTLNTVIR